MHYAVTVGLAQGGEPSDEAVSAVITAIEKQTPLSATLAYPLPAGDDTDTPPMVVVHVGSNRPTDDDLKTIYRYVSPVVANVNAVSRQETGNRG